MRLTYKDFTECFGGLVGCEVDESKFHYEILDYFQPENANLRVVGDKEVWEKGWGENLQEFRETHREDSLIPKYYHPNRVLRLGDNYILPQNPDLEFDFLGVLRSHLFAYFKDYNPIYEFGCGTGFNLLNLSRAYPDKELHGLDWAESSIELVKEVNKAYKLGINPHLFDMFNPSELAIPDGSAVFTWGALEQLGVKFQPFLDFLLSKKIFVINIEPIIELYDPSNPMDKYSIEYMEKRDYLNGYLTALQKSKAEILKIQRIHFGNMNYEGWSFIIWRQK